jgi:hypothetical protein
MNLRRLAIKSRAKAYWHSRNWKTGTTFSTKIQGMDVKAIANYI